MPWLKGDWVLTRLFRFRCVSAVLGLAVAAGWVPRAAAANVTYTYVGNPFNDLRNGGVCPPVCSVTGSFTISQPLAPNLPEVTVITPLSFSLSSAGITLTDGEPGDTSLAVGTDASGAITTWSWVVVGPAASPIARILTESVTDVQADDVRVGGGPPPFVGPVLGLIQNDPGSWTSSVPEPAALFLIGAGLIAIAGARRFIPPGARRLDRSSSPAEPEDSLQSCRRS